MQPINFLTSSPSCSGVALDQSASIYAENLGSAKAIIVIMYLHRSQGQRFRLQMFFSYSKDSLQSCYMAALYLVQSYPSYFYFQLLDLRETISSRNLFSCLNYTRTFFKLKQCLDRAFSLLTWLQFLTALSTQDSSARVSLPYPQRLSSSFSSFFGDLALYWFFAFSFKSSYNAIISETVQEQAQTSSNVPNSICSTPAALYCCYSFQAVCSSISFDYTNFLSIFAIFVSVSLQVSLAMAMTSFQCAEPTIYERQQWLYLAKPCRSIISLGAPPQASIFLTASKQCLK